MKRGNYWRGLLAVMLVFLMAFLPGCGLSSNKQSGAEAETTETSIETTAGESGETQAEAATGETLSHEGYKLDQVVILSRHNIRSPLSGKGSALDTITPHDWFAWTSEPSDLSLRGGVLETEMGQYFRRWAEKEGLFPEDYQPSEKEVRIYANSKQRTIATANFFQAGLLPISDRDVEYHMELDEMDPVFNPQLTFVSDDYNKDVEAQINEMYGEDISGLSDNYKLLEDVIDVKDSEDWKNGNFTGFQTDDTEFILEKDAEPGMNGSLKTACSVSDALVLQYYETDDETAAFGKKLDWQQWEDIAEIKDLYVDVLIGTPLVAANVAHPLLQEIESELNTEGRKFTFLCGHDSNLESVLTALSAEPYSLENSLEKKTPIGSKVVFCRWTGPDGKKYISTDLVYQTAEQLRGLALLDTNNPPALKSIELTGLEKNADGLYEAEQVEKRLKEAIDQYDEIQK